MIIRSIDQLERSGGLPKKNTRFLFCFTKERRSDRPSSVVFFSRWCAARRPPVCEMLTNQERRPPWFNEQLAFILSISFWRWLLRVFSFLLSVVLIILLVAVWGPQQRLTRTLRFSPPLKKKKMIFSLFVSLSTSVAPWQQEYPRSLIYITSWVRKRVASPSLLARNECCLDFSVQ